VEFSKLLVLSIFFALLLYINCASNELIEEEQTIDEQSEIVQVTQQENSHNDIIDSIFDGGNKESNIEAIKSFNSNQLDADNDGIYDDIEFIAAKLYAPVVYLHEEEKYKPSTINWYLDKTHLRFSHQGFSICKKDHQILENGQLDAFNLINQFHEKYILEFTGCKHKETQYSNGDFDSDHHFFLQIPNNTAEKETRKGDSTSRNWKIYFKAYRNDINGITIRYIIFFPYNDGPIGFNHESDFESVNVKLNSNYTLVEVGYKAHTNKEVWVNSADVSLYDETHPYAWFSKGSHGSYQSEEECNKGGYTFDDCTTNEEFRIFTWISSKVEKTKGLKTAGLSNIGAKNFPLNGNIWTAYSGRWGEVGTTEYSSGVRFFIDPFEL